MNLGAFAVVIAVARRARTSEIESYAGLFATSPGLALTMTIFLASLAGIPPLAGWYAKFVMFRAIIEAGAHSNWAVGLAVVAAVNSVIAFFYYSGVIRQMWFRDPVGDEQPPGRRAARPRCRHRADDRHGRRRGRVPRAVRPRRRSRNPLRLLSGRERPDPARHLAGLIRREGPVPFDTFVEAALYGPGGFFASGRGAGRGTDAIGTDRIGGDFITSPEVGPIFGALVGVALDRGGTHSSVPTRSSSSRRAPVAVGSRPTCCAPLRSASPRCDTCSSNARPCCATRNAARLRLEPPDEALGPYVVSAGSDAAGAGSRERAGGDEPRRAPRCRARRRRRSRTSSSTTCRSGSPRLRGHRVGGGARRARRGGRLRRGDRARASYRRRSRSRASPPDSRPRPATGFRSRGVSTTGCDASPRPCDAATSCSSTRWTPRPDPRRGPDDWLRTYRGHAAAGRRSTHPDRATSSPTSSSSNCITRRPTSASPVLTETDQSEWLGDLGIDAAGRRRSPAVGRRRGRRRPRRARGAQRATPGRGPHRSDRSRRPPRRRSRPSPSERPRRGRLCARVIGCGNARRRREQHDGALEALLQEGRTFAPSEAFRKQSLVTGTYLYDDAERDYQGFWAQPGARPRLGAGVDDDLRVGAAVRQVVRRRPAQRLATTASTATSPPATATRSRSTGRASPATPARSPTPSCSTRCSASPTR